MDKKEIIETVNKIKTKPIADLKKDVLGNTSGTNHRALMEYNALLDNITIGPHTVFETNFAGIDWKLRLLTAEEYINIRIDINRLCREKELFDDFYVSYLGMMKVLALSLTPSPFKTEGKTIFSEDDLKLINYDILEELYKQYIDFTKAATRKPSEFSNEEIEAMVDIVKKKPEVSRDLERPRLLTIVSYLLNYCKHLEKMLKPDTNS